MRIVVNSSQVCHLWANQSQSHAHNPGNSVFFTHDTIYSYGLHFPMARHVKNRRGACILYTSRGYSNTTAKHKSYTWRAIQSTATVFTVVNVLAKSKADHAANFAALVAEIVSLQNKIKRARKYGAMWTEQLERAIEHANAYAKFFGLRQRVEIENLDALLESFRRKAAASEKKYAAEVARREEERRKDDLKRLARWLSGDDVHVGSSVPVHMRVVSGHRVQTTLGAEVPLNAARRAFNKIREVRTSDVAWHRNGEQLPVGSFEIESISASGDVVAGCHQIAWAQIESFAQSQGWL